MKKIITCIALGMTSSALMAQETYESAQLATQDLNGTARYVGMGGALEALGADISTISTNPAGVGLFRRGWVGVSGGFTSQTTDKLKNNAWGIRPDDKGITNADLNQIGVVFSAPTGRNSYINYAVNYQKSRNFNQVINAINSLNDASANKMSALRLAQYKPNVKDWKADVDSRWTNMSLVDAINYAVLNDYSSGVYNETGSDLDGYYIEGFAPASVYLGEQKNNGYISNFDFNISGNIDNKVFLGLTFGVKDVHYHSESSYEELLALQTPGDHVYGLYDDRRITGTGYDVKVGAIFRPIETSPFRLGVYVNSPTWYDLKCDGTMEGAAEFTHIDTYYSNSVAYDYHYDYRITTPWRFGASIGTTVGNKFAIGATYEYSDYSTISNRIVNGEGYSSYYDYYYDDYFYDYYRNSSTDRQMNKNTEKSLKGVSLFKVGAEFKPVPTVALRAGYNYQSAIYSKDGYKDMINTNADPDYGSVGSYYSTYDYTNWGDTHRLTFGLGFALSPTTNLDFSYQYITQKGDYHPFQNVNGLTTYATYDGAIEKDKGVAALYNLDGHGGINHDNPTSVKNNRHQLNMTLSYKF